MCWPSANTENSRRTREKPLVPRVYVTLLKPWLGLLNVTGGAFHIVRNSENSGWGDGTHVFQAFHWNFPGNNWNFKKVVLFSRWKISGEKAWSIYEFSQGSINEWNLRTTDTWLTSTPCLCSDHDWLKSVLHGSMQNVLDWNIEFYQIP